MSLEESKRYFNIVRQDEQKNYCAQSFLFLALYLDEYTCINWFFSYYQIETLWNYYYCYSYLIVGDSFLIERAHLSYTIIYIYI
jgi:hypothetical protein